MKIKWESKKLKIRCFLFIWRLATYVIILYKPYSLSGYCDNWISQSKNISENILRDYSDFDLFVIHNRFVSKKIHPLNLFEVFRLRKLMRPFAASDIFYMDCELENRTTTTSGWAQNFRVGRSVATERIVFRSRILSEYSIHVPLEGHFVRLSHDRVSCV